MKNLWSVIKWMVVQIRPYLLLLFIIIITGAITSLGGVGMAIASKAFIDSVVVAGNHIVLAGTMFAAIIVMKIGLQAYDSILSARVSESMSNCIRQKLFMHFTKVEFAELSKYHSGDIITRMTSDVGLIVNGIVYALPGMISLGVGLVAAFITLLMFDSTLAVLAFVLGPVTVLISRIFGRKLKKMHLKMQEAESAYRSYLHECIQNMLIIKTFCYEKESNKQMNYLQGERLNWALHRNRMSVATGSMLSIGYWLGYFLAFTWGAMRLSKGLATFGTLTAFLQLVQQVQSPFIGLARTLPQVISMTASAERLMEFEKLHLEKSDEVVPSYTNVGIVIEGASFEYELGKPILNNISAEIQAGELIGLIGTSGEGKTTLIRIFLSLLQPVSGELYFTNGKRRRYKANADCRTLISYVPQGNTLFSGTIADNLRIGYQDATEDQLIAVLQEVDGWDFVEKLPDRINTVIGERGLGLSEGQAQRIAIARALLRKTPILILDEATSALDINTEQKILLTIRNLYPSRTCIIITHRQSMLCICHRVLKLEDGKLFEINRHLTATPASEAI